MSRASHRTKGFAKIFAMFIIASSIMAVFSHVVSAPKVVQVTDYTPARATKSTGCIINGPYPDPACTPGAIFESVTKDEVCMSGYSSSVRDVSQSLKDAVYAEYGILTHASGEYEVDHFISLELGGSNDITNLFPEAAYPKPGFHEKDKVENKLHQKVCAGEMTLAEAQKEIATDWVQVYNSYINSQSSSNWLLKQ